MHLKEINKEVYFANELIVKVNQSDINNLKELVKSNKRKRIRLCAHDNIKNNIHEMIIVLSKGTYIRPHKHQGKSESFHIIEGLIDVVIFDEVGSIKDVVNMGDFYSGKTFFYRLSAPYYHTPIIRSSFAIFHETVNGPFYRSDNFEAPWAPDEVDLASQKIFLEMIIGSIDNFLN
jgi:cupin fold WbuC family metalloprotein